MPLSPSVYLVDALVEEGRRVGRVPWCASWIANNEAAVRLSLFGITRQETMEETCARRVREREGVAPRAMPTTCTCSRCLGNRSGIPVTCICPPCLERVTE
jgi:hypothetical protein